MSNLRNTTRLPLRTTQTNQRKTHTLTNDLLERKTRALEGSLNKFRFTTHRDQTKSTIELNQTKSKTNSTVKQLIKCGQCEKADAKMKCLECVENYCTSCYTKFHLRGALQRHQCVFLSVSVKRIPSINKPQEVKENSNETSTLASFQHSFLQWREENSNRSKRNQSNQRRINSPSSDSVKLPILNFDESNRTAMKPKTNFSIHILHSNEQQTTDREPSHHESPLPIQTTDSNVNPLVEDEQRPSSARVSIKSTSRPNSSSIVDPTSFRSALESKSTEELEDIVRSQLIPSRPTSSESEKFKELIPNDDNLDTQIDPIPADLLDETKIDLTHQQSATPTPRRHSPFSFSNSLYRTSRINSASSRDTSGLGFFTDVPSRQVVMSPPTPPPPILECSTINEWKHTSSDNQPIEQNPTDLSPQISIKQEEPPVNDTNPPESILANDSSTDTSTIKNMSNDIAVAADSSSSCTIKPELGNSSSNQIENSDKTAQLSANVSKEDVIETNKLEKNEKPIEINVPTKKKVRRRKAQQNLFNHESDGYRRKLEFSFGDGLKWQEASIESLSSSDSIPLKEASPRLSSNIQNIELAEQYSIYDNDDGRSSRACQNSNDDECFHQLHEELCSELDIQGSDEDALMNEQLLRILRDVPNPFDKVNQTSTMQIDIE